MRPHSLWISALSTAMTACLPDEQASFDPTTTDLTTTSTTGEPPSPTEATEPDGPDPGSTGDAASETSAATSTGEASLCGDGVLDPGELCDDGDAFNLETAACLPNCTPATCGDGFVQAGVEQCDLGAANSHDYGGCIPGTCFWGPACGDGEVTPGHELCDPGAPEAPNEGETIPCGSQCRFEGRVVFLSSTTYTGQEIGGLAGADATCRQLARTFDVANFHTYRAWLSDATDDPASTFDPASVPYVLRNGVVIADSFDDLIQTGPAVGITITDQYESITDVRVWTHTAQNGTAIPDDHHCDQWTSDSFVNVAMTGRNSAPADTKKTWAEDFWWTRYIEDTCNVSYHLYCFEN